MRKRFEPSVEEAFDFFDEAIIPAWTSSFHVLSDIVDEFVALISHEICCPVFYFFCEIAFICQDVVCFFIDMVSGA